MALSDNYPQTGSRLEGSDGSNKTRVHVSTNIIIEVDANTIGAIRSLSIDENRQIRFIDEVGTDGHVDSAPQSSTKITGSCERTRFDGLRIAAAFSRPYVHLKSQRIPFDIVIKDLFASAADDNTVLITVIKNVWMNKISTAYKADDFIIVDNMSWEAESIYSTINNTNVVGNVQGGASLLLLDNNTFEKEADRGGRRGALDGAGLLLSSIEGG